MRSSTSIIIFILLLGVSSRAPAQTNLSCLFPGLILKTGHFPADLLAIDTNSDELLDLVFFNRFDRTLGVMLAKGNGEFEDMVEYPIEGAVPISILVADDFDGDSNIDVIACGFTSGTIQLVRGTGTGAFPKSEIIAELGEIEPRIEKADVDADGFSDLIVTTNTEMVHLLYGNGDGTFSESIKVKVGDTQSDVAVADANNDGFTDLAVIREKNHDIVLFHGIGSRRFRLANSGFGSSTSPNTLSFSDLNNDSLPDLIVADDSEDNIRVFAGDGLGCFGKPIVYSVGDSPRNPEIHDINGDGIRDLLIVNSSRCDVSVLLGKGSGTFHPAISYSPGRLYFDSVLSMVVADLNQDGGLDVALAYFRTSDISILFGLGDGAFHANDVYRVGFFPETLLLADFNADGTTDLACTNDLDDNVSVLIGNPDGTFSQAVDYPVGSRPRPIKSEDVNNDGILDLVVGNIGSRNVSVLLGKGDGSFGNASNFIVSFFTNNLPVDLAIGDLNDDGWVDIVCANLDFGNVSNVGVLLGSGNGNFAAPNTIDVGGRPDGVLLNDFDNDEDLDIVVCNSTGPISYVENFGNGNFEFTHFVTDPTAITTRLKTLDVNQDFIPDLVATNYVDDIGTFLTFFIGNGDGTFLEAASHAIGSAPRQIAIGDLNSDGFVDFVTPNYPGDISVLLSDGSFNYLPAVSYEVGENPQGIAICDFNGDSNLDIAVTGSDERSIRVLFGDENATFDAHIDIAAGTRPEDLFAADLNHDSKPDLVVLNFDSRDIGVILNKGLPRVLIGDVNLDGEVNLLDIAPFIVLVIAVEFQPEADINQDGSVDLLDINPLIELLTSQ